MAKEHMIHGKNGKPQRITVKELIDMLSECKPDAEIKMYSDEEGNQINGLIAVQVSNAGVPTFIPFESR